MKEGEGEKPISVSSYNSKCYLKNIKFVQK
jgi:hypothetical protein